MSKDKKILEMHDQFKEYAELKAFSEAQNKTIIDLTKKINQKDEEIVHLKAILEKSTPIIASDKTPAQTLLTDDEESICRMQLRKLRDISMSRELTLEETKKVDIYAKLLLNFKEKGKRPTDNAKNQDTNSLLANLEDLDDTKTDNPQ